MRDRRTIDELTLSELEQLVLTRRREERLRRLRLRGIEAELPESPEPAAPTPEPDVGSALRPPSLGAPPVGARPRPERRPAPRKARDSQPRARGTRRGRLLTLIEVTALIGFVVAGLLWYRDTRQTNLLAPPSPDEGVTLGSLESAPSILPGNPDAPDRSTPIPAIYQEWVQPEDRVASAPLGVSLGAERPTRILIPRLSVDAPVVPGDDWEALKRGAGHHLGSANPGERGNLVISAHNDLFGELFRYLDNLEPGDEFFIYDANNREYRYIVRTKRLVEPTEVSVLDQSPEPLATLITCYPYLVDSHRLVVQAELQN